MKSLSGSRGEPLERGSQRVRQAHSAQGIDFHFPRALSGTSANRQDEDRIAAEDLVVRPSVAEIISKVRRSAKRPTSTLYSVKRDQSYRDLKNRSREREHRPSGRTRGVGNPRQERDGINPTAGSEPRAAGWTADFTFRSSARCYLPASVVRFA
jgi:hypothetical protein